MTRTLPRPVRRRLSALLAWALVTAVPVGAQAPDAPAPTPPAEVVRDFNRAFQSYAWEGLMQRIHPDGLAYLRLAVDILVDYDDTGWFLTEMVGATDRAAYRELPDADVVVRAMNWVQGNAAGLLSTLSGRRTEVLGVVEEGDERHALYRTIQTVQGAEPELRVVTLEVHDGRWKVREGQDLKFLHTALRGIPRPPNGERLSAPHPPVR